MDAQSLAHRLAVLIDDHPSSSDIAPGNSHISYALDVVPHAAGVWTSQERAAFAERLLIDPTIATAQHPGITRSRLRALLPEHRKAQAEELLQWLDAAHVLAPPITPDAPFRHPRRLTCTTAADLRARLAATPHPIFNPPGGSPRQPPIHARTVEL